MCYCRRHRKAVAFQHTRWNRLPDALFLVAGPAQRTHLLQRRLQLREVHLPQLNQFVLCVKPSQPPASPIGGEANTVEGQARSRLAADLYFWGV